MKPAALKALLDGDIENFIAASTPGGIEAQEAAGQRSFVASTTLPIRFNGCKKEQFEAMGISFGEPVDDLFQKAQLPDGWKKVPTDHSMWSKLVDDRGRERAMIFYKAAFYDRDAFLTISRRYSYSVIPVGGWDAAETDEWQAVILDGGNSYYTLPEVLPAKPKDNNQLRGWYAKKDKLESKAEDYLNRNHPHWRDPMAYWT
jgi:hypothetical protein